MSDEAREMLDKLSDTVIDEMMIVKDLMNDRDRWKHQAKIYRKLCWVLLATNTVIVGSQMVEQLTKKGKQN